MSTDVLLSIIIPAHNEERLIGATIASLHEAAHGTGLRHQRDTGLADEGSPGTTDRGYEIIVAADACTDSTAASARAIGALVVEVDHRQISRTRNAGARAARGRWLLFVDADTLVPAAAIREVLDALSEGAVGGGAPINFDGKLPLWGRLMHPAIMILMHTMRWTGGCFLFCTADALHRAGGWDETLFASEEIALSQALKKLRGRRAFRIIPTPVLTSARKLRLYSGGELFWFSFGVLLRGRKSLMRREGLDLWYARREEPAAPPASAATADPACFPRSHAARAAEPAAQPEHIAP
ncbi:MAG: glycosyltransferase [Phycisphaerales bacterium]